MYLNHFKTIPQSCPGPGKILSSSKPVSNAKNDGGHCIKLLMSLSDSWLFLGSLTLASIGLLGLWGAVQQAKSQVGH